MKFYVTDKYINNTEDEELAVVYVTRDLLEEPKSYVHWDIEVGEVTAVRGSDYATKIDIEGIRLYLTVDEWTHYWVYIGDWDDRYEYDEGHASNYNAAEQWVNTGKALFEFEFLAVYIDSNKTFMKLYPASGYYLKAEGEGGGIVTFREGW